MYELQPAKRSNPLLPIYITLGILIGVPVLYVLLLIVGAFLKGFLGL
jgi:hypothetical protein